MTGPLYHLGRFSSRHWRAVLALWLIGAIALVLAGRAAGDRTTDDLTLPGTGSTQASDVLEQHLPEQAYGSNPLVLETERGQLTDSKRQPAVEDTVAALEKTPHVVKVTDPTSDAGAALLSEDGKSGYIPVTLDVDQSDLSKEDAQAILDAAQPAVDVGMDVSLGGYAGQTLSKPSTHMSEVVGLVAAVIILLFAFGSAAAMLLPIVTAIVGLVCALALIRLTGLVTDVPTIAPTLATMIGLGVGIDYALFIVTRHKQQLRGGMAMGESVSRATATAGGAVLFAGGTVVIALCALVVAGIPLVTTLGYTAAIAVVVSVLSAITLLPALLGALGPRIDAGRVRFGRSHPDDHQPHGWARWARGVAARPWRSLVASVAILAVLAMPVLQLHLGQSDTGALPESTTARQAYDGMSASFGAGSNGPLLVSVELGSPAKADDPRLADLNDAIAQTDGVKSVSPPTLDKSGTHAVFTVVSETSPSSRETEDLVNELRDSVIPAAIDGTDLTVYVGGQTAGYIDLAERIADELPRMIAIVVALSFVILMLAFRSVVVPLKAAAMNLLSVAAAYGVVTAVFQNGHGATAIGLDGAIPIVSFVPLLMFAILFGLSMDYEVFLMTQIQEHFHDHGKPVRAVIEGLANTGRVITSAALIMVCVFTSFVLSGDPIVKEFGIGLAIAIAIDATIVRCLLVPAVMTLLGRASWWMPRRLDRWTPRISIEGQGYFAREGSKS